MSSVVTDNYTGESAKNAERKACEFPVNRTYTSAQNINTNDSQKLVYNTPYEWSSSRSNNKCVGLREAKLIPYECSTTVNFNFRRDTADEPISCYVDVSVKSSDDMTTVLTNLCNACNDKIHSSVGYGEAFSLFWKNDYNDGRQITIYSGFTGGDDEYEPLTFSFTPDTGDLTDFMRIFNQSNPNVFTNETTRIVLNNVWNRKNIYVHSSISSDFNQLLCENNAKYSPRKYLFPFANNMFDIWFTTDLSNVIPFNDCGTFLLKLSFIYNFRNAAI